MMFKTLPRQFPNSLNSNNASSCPELRANGLDFLPLINASCFPKKSLSFADLKTISRKQSPILNALFKKQNYFEKLTPCTSRFWNNTEPALRIFSGDVEGDYAVILHLLGSAGIIPSGSLITPFLYSGKLIINPSPETPSKKENISNIYLPEFVLSDETKTLKEIHPIHIYSSGDLIDRGPHGLECLLTLSYLCNLANTDPNWDKITLTITMGNHDICYFLTPKFIDHVEYVLPTAYGYSEDSDGYNLAKKAYHMLFQNTKTGPSKPVFCKVNIDNMSVVSHAPITEGKEGFLPLLSDSWNSNPLFFKEQIANHFGLTHSDTDSLFIQIAQNLKKESTSFFDHELAEKKQWLLDLEFAINSHLYLPTFYDNSTINVPLSFTKTIKDDQGEDFNLQNFNEIFIYLYYFYNERTKINHLTVDSLCEEFSDLYKQCNHEDAENKKNNADPINLNTITQKFITTRDSFVTIIKLCTPFDFEDKTDWTEESGVAVPTVRSDTLIKLLEEQSFDDLLETPKRGALPKLYQIRSLLQLLNLAKRKINLYFSEFSQVDITKLKRLHDSDDLIFTKDNYDTVKKAINLCHELDYPEKAVLSWGHLFHDKKSPCWQRFTDFHFDETCRPIKIDGIYGHDTGRSHEPAEYHFKDTITLKLDTAQSFCSQSTEGYVFEDKKRHMKIYDTIPTTLLYNKAEAPIINSLCHPLRFLSGLRHPKRGISMKDVKEHYGVAVIPKEAIDIDYPKGKYCNAYFPDPLMRMTRYLPMTKDLVNSEHGYLSQLQHFIIDTSK